MFGKRKNRPDPDEGSVYYALLYAVSLRQRRREDGRRAYTWAQIRAQSNFPGTLYELIVEVTLHLDELERVSFDRMEQQQRERTTDREVIERFVSER